MIRQVKAIESNDSIVLSSEKGVADGVASLDTNVLVPLAQLPVISTGKGGTGLSSIGSGNQVLGINSGANGLEYKTINGTTNQVAISHAANSITLSTPQNIHTGASPTFDGLTLNNNLSQADAKYISTDQVRARDGDGLKLCDDSGNGILIKNGGNVGIGTNNPEQSFDVVAGDGKGMRISDIETNNTRKIGVYAGRHYNNSEEDVMGLFVDSTATSSEVDIGGRHGSFNAVKVIKFWTAVNNTTTAGTERMIIDGLGNVGIGTSDQFGGGVGVFSIANAGTNPSSNPTDAAIIYSADAAGAESASIHFRNEQGHVIKLYKQSHIADADGDLANIQAKFNTLLANIENLGLLATS